MAQEVIVSGRIVQGEVKLRGKTDDKNQPVMDKSNPPQQVQECYIGLAIPKNSQDWNTIWAAMNAEARAYWPALFDAQGNMVLRDFAWKYIDGDGRDSQGRPYSEREGFAGHYVLKLATRFLPKCYPAQDKLNVAYEIADPSSIIKCGDYVGVIVHVAPNEVQPGGQAKCGLYLSPNKIVFLAQGKRIESGGGMSAEQAFTGRQFALPAGVVQGAAPTMTPPAAAGAPLPPPAAAGAPLPPPAAGAAPPPPPAAAAAPPPPPARTLVIQPQFAAQGITREGLNAQGHGDDAIVANGWGFWQ